MPLRGKLIEAGHLVFRDFRRVGGRKCFRAFGILARPTVSAVVMLDLRGWLALVAQWVGSADYMAWGKGAAGLPCPSVTVFLVLGSRRNGRITARWRWDFGLSPQPARVRPLYLPLAWPSPFAWRRISCGLPCASLRRSPTLSVRESPYRCCSRTLFPGPLAYFHLRLSVRFLAFGALFPGAFILPAFRVRGSSVGRLLFAGLCPS